MFKRFKSYELVTHEHPRISDSAGMTGKKSEEIQKVPVQAEIHVD